MDGDLLKIILSLMILIVPVVGRALKKAGKLPEGGTSVSADNDDSNALAAAGDVAREKQPLRKRQVSCPPVEAPENVENEDAEVKEPEHRGRKFIDDPKKLVIYSEIMRPKFKD